MRGCLSSLLQVLTCGLVRLGAGGEPELAAPLLGEPSPQRRRGAPLEHGVPRTPKRGSGKTQPPDTSHVLEHGHRDIYQDYSIAEVLGQGGCCCSRARCESGCHCCCSCRHCICLLLF